MRKMKTLGMCASLATAALLATSPAASNASAPVVRLESAQVATGGSGQAMGYDGVVEAVRQTQIAAQISGAVLTLNVKVGDMVKAGQVLARLDARAAERTAAASAAQVEAAHAAREVASRDYERNKLLFAKGYISQAALDRAEAQYKSAQAQAAAQVASAQAARVESDFYVVRAPYASVISDVPVVLGDMAMPGRRLLTLYDPAALRVSVAIPQTLASGLPLDPPPLVELPDVMGGRITPIAARLLPSVDPATHTQELRLDLPEMPPGVRPGMFARVWLAPPALDTRLYVPASAVLRRAELTVVYVIADDGTPRLRQVRIGRRQGESLEVLSGLGPQERVALDPQAAARMH
jgi:RND family efflux transporter MFP subunit